MSTVRNAAMNYLPKAALALTVMGILGFPISLQVQHAWAQVIPVLALGIGVFCALVYGLMGPSTSASVVMWCMGLYLVAMVFKVLHYPGAAFMLILSFGAPMVLFLVGTLALPFRYARNLFLILIGGLAGLVLIAGYFASLSKMLYWHNAELLFSWFAPGYVVVTIALLVGIQITDFVQWEPAPRRFLTNNILVPWAFLFLVAGSILLLPREYFNLIRDETDWGMVKEEQTGGS